MSKQEDIFLHGEADRWFQRNKKAVEDSVFLGFREINWLSDQLLPFNNVVKSVLEVGCSSGEKLRQLCSKLSCRGVGIDPSSQAVKVGNAKGDVQLFVGTASSLPFAANSFDLVYFGFCLYLIDRSTLLTVVAEADRVLKPGGFLAITDFDPIVRHKKAYHHKEGVFSYKQDYSTCFTQSGLYSLIAKHSSSLRQAHFDVDGNERVSTTILFKEIDPN